MNFVHLQTILSRRHSGKRKFSQNKGFPTVKGFTGVEYTKEKDASTQTTVKNSWSDAKQNMSKYVPRPRNKASTNGPRSDICNVMSFHIIGGLLQSYVTKPDRDWGSGSKLLSNLYIAFCK